MTKHREETPVSAEPEIVDAIQDMCDFLIEIEPLAIEYNELAQQGEMEKSGDELEVPSGYIALPACPRLSKSTLEGTHLMFEWDSGWEFGMILRVSGRQSEERVCLVQFAYVDDQQTVELHTSNYYTDNNKDGIWVSLVETE